MKLLEKDIVFEAEEGFDFSKKTKKTKELYIDSYDNVHYKSKKRKTGREYPAKVPTRDLWLYIIVIYGAPIIEIYVGKGNSKIELMTLVATEVKVGSEDNTGPMLSYNAVSCQMREPFLCNTVYFLHWNMNLLNEIVAGKRPKHGLMTLRLFKQDTSNTDRDGTTIWEASSAVQHYPYSGRIALRLDANKKIVEHNLLLKSVEYCIKDEVDDDIEGQTLFLDIEFSYGELSVTRNHKAVIQDGGSMFLIRDYKTDQDCEDLKRHISSTTGFLPSRIQFGMTQDTFVVEFYKPLSNSDIQAMKHNMFPMCEQIKHGSAIQVLGVPDEVTKDDLESYFTRRQSGGGEVISLSQDVDVPGCWVINFERKSVARKICLQERHLIMGKFVDVLYFYDGLGCAVSSTCGVYGERPEYNTDDITLTDLDGDKLLFLKSSKPAQTKFEDYLRKCVDVKVTWEETDAFAEVAENQLTFVCDVSARDHKKLANWKALTRKTVRTAFTELIVSTEVEIIADLWNPSVEYFESKIGQFEFLHVEQIETSRIKVIGLNMADVKTLVDDLQNYEQMPIDRVTQQINISLDTYKALEEEGLLAAIKTKYSSSSYKIARGVGTVTVEGTRDEVREAAKETLQVAVDSGPVELHISDGVSKFLSSNVGSEYIREALRKNNMNPEFIIRSGKLIVTTILTSGSIRGRRTDAVKTILDKCIVVVEIPSAKSREMSSSSWNEFKKEREEENVFISEKSAVEIEVVSLADIIATAKKEVETYFNEEVVTSETVTVPYIVAEYLDKFKPAELRHECTCMRGRAKEYTGKVSIISSANTVAQIKEQLLANVKEVKTYWMVQSSSWLASVIHEVSGIRQIVTKKQCIITADIGDTLAANNIACVVIFEPKGAVIQAKLGNIAYAVTDCIVNSAYPNMEFNKGISKTLAKKGGAEIQDECRKEVETNGKVEVGNVFLGKSGRLRCLNIIHAVGPKWRKGDEDEESQMKTTITAVLNVAHDKGFTSVAMPPLRCDVGQYPDDLAASHTVEAIAEFFQNLPDESSTVKEVCLYADTQDLLQQFSKAMSDLAPEEDSEYDDYDNNGWKCFQHGRKLPNESTFPKSRNTNAESKPLVGMDKPEMPLTFKDDAGIFWNKEEDVRITFGDGNEKDPRQSFATSVRLKPRSVESCFKDGLPYVIPVSDKLKLHVLRGDLAHQQVDIIVNTTYSALHGAVTDALLLAAGQVLRDEFENISEMAFGDIRDTGAGQLPCKRVYHALVRDTWNTHTGRDDVYQVVKECLTKASKELYTSVAFPTIGTGKSNFPANVVAEAMVKAVCEHVSDDPISTLADVSIVVYANDVHTSKVFENEIPNVIKPFEEMSEVMQDDMKVTMYKRTPAKYIEPPSFEEHTEADDVVLFKIVSTKDSLKIRTKLEEVIEKEFIKKEFNYLTIGGITSLTENEITLLTTLETKHGVGIIMSEYDTVVEVSGLKDRVGNAELEVLQLLQFEFPTLRNKEQIQHRLKQTVQWYFDDNGAKKNFDSSSNYEIHIGFSRGHDFFYYNPVEEEEYKILIGSQEEHPKSDPSKRRQIYQRTVDVGEIGVPNDWQIATTDEEWSKVLLHSTDSSYLAVSRQFREDGCTANTIVNIFRLEHKYMWQMYQAKKKQMDQQNPNVKNEQLLWHGTDSDTVGLILKGGYDRSFCGKNATAYGEGAYFANTSSYSDGYADPDGLGIQRMFRNRVLTGIPTTGYDDLCYLPMREMVNGMPVLYDSATDDEDDPSMFIIFHDSQAYPEYLIEYMYT